MRRIFSRGTTVQGRVITRVIDRSTGRIVGGQKKKNLVLDQGLNFLAAGGGFGNFFAYCYIGNGGATPNEFHDPSNMFTQDGTTITAASLFFTPAMVGGIFKFSSGSGGVEQYIAAMSGTPVAGVYPACVVEGAGQTVTTGDVGTVWQVQQTALASPLYSSNTYNSTGNSSVYSNGVLTLTRTINIASQTSTYYVSEIAYGNGNANGRIVLPVPDTVTRAQYYQVLIQIAFTISPAVPTAVGNVGSSVNTSGQAVLQCLDCQCVNASGNTVQVQTNSPSGLIDGSLGNTPTAGLILATPALSNMSAPGTLPGNSNGLETVAYQLGNAAFAYSGKVGVGILTIPYSVTVAAVNVGGLVIGYNSNPAAISNSFVQAFTAPISLTAGTFTGILTFTNTYARTLTN